jgi:predicted HTH transcriptional regulator
MAKRIQYSDEPIGEARLVPDFLPSPEMLALNNDQTKVTMYLNSETVAYFKAATANHHMQYQKMIRQLLDEYVAHQKRAERLLASRQLMLPFEERPVLGADLAALNRTRFERYHERRFGRQLADSALSYERLLGNLKLAVQDDDGVWRPTNIGLLLFCDRPDQHLGGAYVDLAVYDHPVADGNTRDSKRVTGPVTEQIEWVLTYLRTSPMLTTLSRKDALGRIDKPSYSEFALQEAVVNALAHRDYEITGAQVILTLFPDRLEIRNPGGLHNSLTEENLYAGCQPVRRNQILAGFLRDYESPATGRRYMETRGEGFLTLVSRSLALSGRRPELVNMGGAVKLTLFAARPDA